jgi:hypothetical protein
VAATVTLATTTLLANIAASDGQVQLGSTSGVLPGVRLFIDGELMTVLSLGLGTSVNVQRGHGGTATAAHGSNQTVYIGRADQFYMNDPVGVPPTPELVSPWINTLANRIWLARGDEVGLGAGARWWQQVTTTYDVGALGVRTATQSPT